ncbi:hypothetical protein [Candidatus Mycoplasma haematominutum]|uniref:hypothetical protein n=1 Tax=Candidatus Mycoplasma haematominutum TaxID=209446 RepID=UPI00030C6AD5|nr:hypothetical protein [Candidatus Mycoplasma haematominutum]
MNVKKDKIEHHTAVPASCLVKAIEKDIHNNSGNAWRIGKAIDCKDCPIDLIESELAARVPPTLKKNL